MHAVGAFNRVGTYWHMLPEYAQARKAIWDAVNPHTGKRRIDEAFPAEIRANTRETDMFIRFQNGSTWQVVGSDNYNALVGTPPVGLTGSEWALANPMAWAYLAPIMAENKGWASFITTPRGNNHVKGMYDRFRTDPKWFVQLLKASDTGAISAEAIEDQRGEYAALFGEEVADMLIEQEFNCSFSGAMLGAYFGREMMRAERDGRFKIVEIDWKYPVHTAWDLGKAVNNPIWCFQVIKGELRIVDFYRPESDDLEEWVRWLDDKGYKGNDYVPHDILVTEWGTKRTRIETLKMLGRRPKRVVKVAVADGLQAGRKSINQAIFHAGEGERGERLQLAIDGLKAYRREWDDELKTFRENPVKDWAEHIGSAWRYLGLAWKDAAEAVPEKPKAKELVYTAKPGGVIQSNISIQEAIDAMVRRKRRGE